MVACQFKNVHVLQWFCMLHKKLKVPHIWNYFKSGNRKGEHDGACTCIKITLWGKEMKFTTTSLIQDEKSIVEWCSFSNGRGNKNP
jgi:hypothetical protein